jgi:predicted ArsR family transcriptional regulator
MPEVTNQLDDETNVLLIVSRGAKTRRRILQTLKSGLMNCNQIAEQLNIDWWTVQKHLQRLEKAELIKNVTLGRIRFYKTTSKGQITLKYVFLKPPE